MDMLLYIISPSRCLNLPLEKIVLELNFIVRNMVCYREMQVHLTHWVARESFATSLRKEATSCSLNLFRELRYALKNLDEALALIVWDAG